MLNFFTYFERCSSFILNPSIDKIDKDVLLKCYTLKLGWSLNTHIYKSIITIKPKIYRYKTDSPFGRSE